MNVQAEGIYVYVYEDQLDHHDPQECLVLDTALITNQEHNFRSMINSDIYYPSFLLQQLFLIRNILILLLFATKLFHKPAHP